METNYSEEQRYHKAQKKVQEIKAFYIHLTLYLLCNPIIIVVNLLTSPWFLWSLFCVFGWGIPIVLHGLIVFKRPPFFDKNWEERKIKEILEEENKKQKWE